MRQAIDDNRVQTSYGVVAYLRCPECDSDLLGVVELASGDVDAICHAYGYNLTNGEWEWTGYTDYADGRKDDYGSDPVMRDGGFVLLCTSGHEFGYTPPEG